MHKTSPIDKKTDAAADEELLAEDSDYSRTSGCFPKIVALLILAAFVAFSIPQITYIFSDRYSFLTENTALRDDQIVQKCSSAVVSIEAVSRNEPISSSLKTGTGFNVSPSGTIITNRHVVEDSDTITVTFDDGTRYYANQYEIIPGADIAIIKIKGNDLPALEIDWENKVKQGDMVTIIGNPLGFEKIAQQGKVGGYHKMMNSQSLVFDIELQVNPGSSGSPVINEQARVVGIVFAGATADINGKNEPRALAVPVQALSEQSL